MRLVFAGTPAPAVASLEALLGSRHEVAAVVTRPDAPAGRGLKPGPSPVARRAAEAGVEILRPARPRDPEFVARLTELAPDCCPVTAYGALIPDHVLEIPSHGWVNLHFSILPAWRGAAPVPHAILHGDDMTGATTFRLVHDLDAGPTFGVLTEPIRDSDTTGTLLERLSVAGAELLVTTLDMIEDGRLEVALERNAARTLINDLSRKLEQWTGRRWTVIVSNEPGQPTLRSQMQVEKNQREQAAEADPRVKEVLARFPGAKVVEVRRLAPEPPESDASGEDPAERPDSDDE